MWFDTEPKFLYYMDSNITWWNHYGRWIRGEGKFPGNNHSISEVTLWEGSVLITMGLVPLILAFIGGCYYIGQLKDFYKFNWMELNKLSIFPVLLITNAAGIIQITLKLPVFSTIKASYFLGSMPAFAVFLAKGLMAYEKQTIVKWAIIIIFGALFVMVSLHILHICSFLYGK